MKQFNHILGAGGMAARVALSGFASAETLRWARSGDSLTLDPHAQNEGQSRTQTIGSDRAPLCVGRGETRVYERRLLYFTAKLKGVRMREREKRALRQHASTKAQNTQCRLHVA